MLEAEPQRIIFNSMDDMDALQRWNAQMNIYESEIYIGAFDKENIVGYGVWLGFKFEDLGKAKRSFQLNEGVGAKQASLMVISDES